MKKYQPWLLGTSVVLALSCATTVYADEDTACASATSASLPFSFDGVDEACYVVDGTISYINSWVTDTVTVNGEDYTNTWSASMPDAIDGKYYIYYVGSYDWSHVEVDGEDSYDDGSVDVPVEVESYELTISVVGSGTTSPSVGTYDYDEGEEVEIEAIADDGYEFAGWSGDSTSTSSTITLTIDADTELTATFEAIEETEDPVDEEEETEDPVDEEEETEEPTESVSGIYRIDENGYITENGSTFEPNCVSWFGLEGQHEPSDAEYNAGGAPMELYVGNMWWVQDGDEWPANGTGRTIEQTIEEAMAEGVNLIRLPIAPQTLDETDPQGIGSIGEYAFSTISDDYSSDYSADEVVLKNHPDVVQDNARQALEDFITTADAYGLKVIIDIHSCSNYIGWRAGDLEATPPYVDADRVDYDYTREDYACGTDVDDGVTVHEYNEEKWLETLAEVAGLSEELGVDNIMGIDIFNEPWNYTWSEWKDLAEKAYDTISAVNDDMLIIVEGVGSALKDDTAVEHGDESSAPNWGENLYGFASDPLDIPQDRLVLSPHTYGPSVYVKNIFLDQTDPNCEGLEGDEAGEADCDIVIDSETLEAAWEEHFGYLRDEGYAVLIGEFGGMIDWPAGADDYYQDLWDHLSDDDVDEQWQNALVDYMVDQDIEGCYWSLNPESADTGGLYNHAWEADTNEGGWGTWEDFNETKLDIVKKLWN